MMKSRLQFLFLFVCNTHKQLWQLGFYKGLKYMQYLDVVILSKIIWEFLGVSNSIVCIKGANHKAPHELGIVWKDKKWVKVGSN
jgi:hypothetical protein